MDFRKTILYSLGFYCLFNVGCACDDEFGRDVEFVLPVNTSFLGDTITVNDTIWIDASFDKRIQIKNNTQFVELANFNFFTEFLISEISDTIEKFDFEIQLVQAIGQIEQLPLVTAITYPIKFEETIDFYMFKCGIIIKNAGLYRAGFASSSFILDRYDHPWMTYCNDRQRNLSICYENDNTDQSRFENLFLSSQVEYLTNGVSFEDYKNAGAISFVVVE